LALDELGFKDPTQVQQKTIPLMVSGTHLLVRSQTGTGKTAAFGIGLIERYLQGKSKHALVLTPTRELAVQVANEIQSLSKHTQINIPVVYGGSSMDVQIASIQKGMHIIVATPGRLLDISRRGEIDLSKFDTVVLDEADQMLDMGFIDDVSLILDSAKKCNPLIVLISATLDYAVMQVANKYLVNPKTIEVGDVSVASTVEEEYIEVTDMEKLSRLVEILHNHRGQKILIFRETKMAVSRLEYDLQRKGFKVGSLQGDLSQSRRNAVIEAIKEGSLDILVATNVASRGLHIDNLNLVINYDPAQSADAHVHRVGRTGRMGSEGKAITFVRKSESRESRMSDDHPDFAWMKGGNPTSTYQNQRRYPDRRSSSSSRFGYSQNRSSENRNSSESNGENPPRKRFHKTRRY
jgi:ATP-dependent RNA helicase DeaD